jgi:hypothetical protein
VAVGDPPGADPHVRRRSRDRCGRSGGPARRTARSRTRRRRAAGGGFRTAGAARSAPPPGRHRARSAGRRAGDGRGSARRGMGGGAVPGCRVRSRLAGARPGQHLDGAAAVHDDRPAGRPARPAVAGPRPGAGPPPGEPAVLAGGPRRRHRGLAGPCLRVALRLGRRGVRAAGRHGGPRCPARRGPGTRGAGGGRCQPRARSVVPRRGAPRLGGGHAAAGAGGPAGRVAHPDRRTRRAVPHLRSAAALGAVRRPRLRRPHRGPDLSRSTPGRASASSWSSRSSRWSSSPSPPAGLRGSAGPTCSPSRPCS